MNKRPLILLVNDDGITAPGLKALKEVAEQFGELLIVAPDSPQSAKGHAVTIGKPLRLKENKIFDPHQAFECSGTPADCVKIALSTVSQRKPDLCLSGINHGSNASINIVYSGTMAAALEAAIDGVPAIGFSLLDFSWEADFSHARKFMKLIIEQTLKNGLESNTLLNINIPARSDQNILGIKICRQANAKWQEEFVERKDPFGRSYYWLTGKFLNNDLDEDTDLIALQNNYISIVPVLFDFTAQKGIQHIKQNWNFDKAE